MLKKFIKEIFKTAVVSTIFGFPFRADTSQTLKQFFTSQLQFYTAITTLSYISAKSSGDTANRNLGIKRAITNPIAPRNIVYGKTRVGGTIVQRTLTAKSASTKNVLHQVIALAGHEINNITKIYIDAGKGIKELDLSDTNDFVSATENSTTVFRCVDPEFVNTDNDEAYTGGSLIKLAFEKGDQTAANGYAVAQMSSASAWSTDHKMLGIAYIYINCIYDTEKFTQIPSFSFEIEGKKVFDPVSSSTVYSTNPALIIRDYLMDSTYGFGATSTEINDAVTGAGFVKARSDCNDSVSITSGTESRYTLNGQFTSTEEPQTVLETMLSACAGQLLYNNGVFSLFVGKERTASGTITDDKILEPIQIQTKFSGRELANGVKATYVRPSDEYIAAEITPYKDSTYLTQDTPSGKAQADYENFLNLSFPYTQSSFTAQRLARIALDYQRQNQTLSVLVPLEFLSHQVGDIVNLDNDRLGYSGKDFEIVGMSFEFVGEQYLALRLSLKEYSTTVFNNITYVADPTLPSPPDSGDNTVSSPTGLALAEFIKDSQVRLHFIRASWTNNLDDKIVTTEVAYKKSTDTNFDAADVSYPSNSFSFYVEPATTYNVKVRHISNTGVSSAYTGTVNLTTSGGQVTLTTGTVAGITIESGKLYQGTGTFNNSNTGFYIDSTGQFSLKDKLSFNGTTLNISGNLTVENTISANKIVVDGINLDNLISASTQAGSIYLTEFTGIKIATAGGTSGYPPLLRLQDDQGTNTFTDITQSQTGINIRARANTAKGTITFQGIDSGITPSTYASFDASGDMAFNNNVTISGDLTVSGTTTTINTTNLDVADKNITLNFGAGDTSSNANGAGITIQDAVDASTDATLLWDSTNDKFDFSHSIQVPDNANVKVGSAGDLFMVHNGSNSFIQNKVGDFYIENASDDKDIFFRSDDGSGGLATYMTIDGSHSRMTIAKNTLLFDNVELRIGDNSGAGDLKIYHNGTDSYIQNHTGSLNIENLSDDKDIYFKSDDGSGGLTTYFFLDGSDSTTRFTVNPLKFNDNIKALFGTGSDLEIFHNGTNSVINDAGTGDLIFQIAGSEKGRITSTAFSFQGGYSATGSFNTTLGAYQINGTTVIDSLRNLTNINNITCSGDVLVAQPNPTLILQDTSDDDDHGIRFRDNGGTDRYSITTLNDNFNFITEGSRSIIFKPAGTAALTLDNSQNATFAGTISSGHLTVNTSTFKTTNDAIGLFTTDLTVGNNVAQQATATPKRVFFNNDYSNGFTDASLKLYLFNDDTTRAGLTSGPAFDMQYHMSGSSSGRHAFYIQNVEKARVDNGGIDIKSGGLDINGTEVITSARNLTNIGTISSGDITSSGKVKGSNMEILGASGSSGFLYIFDSDNGTSNTDGFLLQKSGNSAFVYNREATGNLSLGSGNTSNYFVITSSGAIQLGTTQILDQSRNLTNIGNISSSGIFSCGGSSADPFSVAFDVGNSVTISNDGSFGTSGTGRYVALGFGGSANGSNRIFAHNTGNDGLYLASATSKNIVFRTNGGSANTFKMTHDGALQIGSSNTTIIDSSRNLTNIGTFSSTNFMHVGNSTHDADARLHVAGNTTNPDLSSTTPSNYTALFSNSDGQYGMMFATYGSGAGEIQQRRINNNTSYNLYLNPHGANVGIGVTAATQKLNVGGSLGISGTTVMDSSRNLTNIGTITNTGRHLIQSGNLQMDNGNNSHRYYYVSTGSGGGDFLLGQIEVNDGVDGAIEGTVCFAYDYGTTSESPKIHFSFAQRNGTARGSWWYEHDDDAAGSNNVKVVLIDDGSGGMFVWLRVSDFAKLSLNVITRQGGNWISSGQLSSGTITTGTTLFDTSNDPTSEHHIGKLFAHGDSEIEGQLTIGSGNNIVNAGNMTVDVAGDLTLDADGGDIMFKDGGSEKGRFGSSGFSVVGNTAISGNFNTSLGGYQVGGQTVISSSRVLENIDTLVITGQAGGGSVLRLENNSWVAAKDSGGTHRRVLGSSSNTLFMGDVDASFTDMYLRAPATMYVQTNNTTALTLDSSQNATFAGSIITSKTSEAILLDSAHSKTKIGLFGGIGTGAEYIGTSANTVEISGTNINFNGASGSGTPNLKMGTTTVIDSSRNLTNIGTISSGNITSSGTEFILGSSSVKSRIRTINASGFTETAFDNFSSGAYQERMRISSSGSVGIAKTNPSSSYKLDVNGKIRSQQEILINTGSLFINEEGEGIHILSANGTEYKLTVSNAGALVITEV
jgi:hypothetical protein